MKTRLSELPAIGQTGLLEEAVGIEDDPVAALELEKAAYEIVYEANNRPDWLEIPVRGFVNATAALARAAGAA